jgi:hypothetical protein
MNTGTDTGTVPRLEQLDFLSGFCPVRKSVPKPKLHRALTPREKDVLKQVRALNDPLIIEAINLFNATIVRDSVLDQAPFALAPRSADRPEADQAADQL